MINGLKFQDERFVGFFEFKGHRTSEVVMEEIVVGEAWVKANLEPGIGDNKKKIGQQSRDRDPNQFIPVPSCLTYLDIRPNWKVKYVPKRTIDGKVIKIAKQAEKCLKSADGLDKKGLYKKIYSRVMVPAKYKVKFNDGMTVEMT